MSVTYEANILSDLSDLVNTSWIDQTKYRIIGNEWDMKFVLDDHQASTTTIRGEIVDLSAVFESFLFQAVNYTASRPAQFLRPEAYPPMTTTRSSWGPSVQGRGLKGADVCASLRRDGDTTLIQEIDRIVMESKGPASIPVDSILSGIRTVHAEGHGFRIRRDMTDGTYVTHENVDKSCTDALLQVRVLIVLTYITNTLRHSSIWIHGGQMDSRRTKVGVLTNYNVFLVILRTGKDKIVLSSPVIRDRISRASLEPGLANDVSVWKLLLALLLYVGRPENLQGKTGIWADL